LMSAVSVSVHEAGLIRRPRQTEFQLLIGRTMKTRDLVR
jgi:hypothetical protein